MAIVKQPALAALYGRAAAITGESQKAQREIEASMRAAEQMRAIQIQRAREERSQQRQLESEERSHQWEMEKMEMRSRVDFAEQEGRRQEKRANLQAAVKKIDELAEAGQITPENAEKHKTKAIMGFYDVSLSDRALGLIPETDEREKAPSRTDVGAALKFLAEVEEKEKGWGIPYWSDPGPTPEERAAVPYYQDILHKAGMGAGQAAETAGGMAPVEQDVNINVRPSSKQEFKTTVSQLKAVDPTKAQAYFDKYIGAFEW